MQPRVDVDPELLRSIEGHAVLLARDAGALLLDSFQRDHQVEYKSEGNRDPVTEADKQAEELLAAGIRDRFPDHGILGEETPESQGLDNDFIWVLDPLDGTYNFLNRYPFFGVSVGVLHRGVPVVGAMFVPSPLKAGGQVLHARSGSGAFADDEPIHAHDGEGEPGSGLVSLPGAFRGQFQMGKELRRQIGEVRTTGSIVYEISLVASGVLRLAAFGGPRIWDVAAGVVIVREAGGEALAWTGRQWEPMLSFLERSTGLPSDGDLRQWRTGLVMSSKSLSRVVSAELKPRGGLLRWLRHQWTRIRARTWARGRAGGSPALETPLAPEGPTDDAEAPSTPREATGS